MSNSKLSIVGLAIIVLSLLATLRTNGQTGAEPMKVNFCDVVASPAEYNGKTLSVEVILNSSEHALYLYGPACVRPREGYDDSTQAVLPTGWESLPNGKKLRSILKHRRPAKVEVIGTFESGDGRYGPDGAARFRFSISQINAVSEDPARKTREALCTTAQAGGPDIKFEYDVGGGGWPGRKFRVRLWVPQVRF